MDCFARPVDGGAGRDPSGRQHRSATVRNPRTWFTAGLTAVAQRPSVEEYLSTTYRPDCDYVDGELVARKVGERDRGDMQRQILLYLCTHFRRIAESVLPQQRVQVKAGRFRVPDICVLRADSPDEQVVRTAPALFIERDVGPTLKSPLRVPSRPSVADADDFHPRPL